MYLGVDGGGTKTAFVLINKNGEILAEHVEATSYYIEIGVDGLRDLLINGIRETFLKANHSIASLNYAFFGLPAYGEDSSVTDTINNIPAELIMQNKYQCGNDMIPGWASALGCKDGINIVAGTGSIAYGEINNSRARCGGWGEVFSDEGSAYWIAKSGLNAFTRMSDGRLTKGPLYLLFKEHFQLTSDLDICGIVMNQLGGTRSWIAKLSLVVHQAAIAGDIIAKDIFDKAGYELSQLIHGVSNQLCIKDEQPLLVSYSGGVFNADEVILQPLKSNLSALSKNYCLVAPKYNPVVGAALYAAKLDGCELSSESLLALKI